MPPYLGFGIAGVAVVALGALVVIFSERVTIFLKIYFRSIYGEFVSRNYRRWFTVVTGCFWMATGVCFAVVGVIGFARGDI